MQARCAEDAGLNMTEGGGRAPVRLDDPETRERIFRFALRLTGDRDVSDEAAQEALTRTLATGERVAEIPWLFRVALNFVRDLARRRKVRRRDGTDPATLVDTRIAEPSECAAAAETKARVWTALGKLPDREREVLVLRLAEGLTCLEIARVQDTSPNAVSCLLRRAKERFRTLFEEGGRP
jgi:RNA polymerase sigma factor (sigma-70 family)